MRDQLGPHLTQLVAAGFLVLIRHRQGERARRFRYHVQARARFLRRLRSFLPPPGTGRIAVGASCRRAGDRRAAQACLPLRREANRPAGRLGRFRELERCRDRQAASDRDQHSTRRQLSSTSPWRRPRRPISTFRPWEAFASTSQVSRHARQQRRPRRTAKLPNAASEDERLAYDAYRRKELAAIFEALPGTPSGRKSKPLARQAAAGFGGSLADAMVAPNARQITAQRYGDRIKSFEDWKAAA